MKNKYRLTHPIDRRTFIKVSGALAAGTLLSGTFKSKAQSSGKTRLSYVWPFAAATGVQEELVRRFNEQSNTTEVELRILPQEGVVAALTTAFSAGAGPDVVAMSPGWLTQFAAAGWLESLEPQITASGLDSTLLPIALIQSRMYQNTAFMVGSVVDTYPLYYNLSHFEEAGITAAPETTEEFAEIAAQLTDFKRNRYGYYQLGGPQWSFQQWSTWMLTHGGIGDNNSLYEADGTCIFRRPNAVAGLADWVALYQDAQVSPLASATGTFNDAANAFSAEQVSMVFGFLGYIQNFSQTLGTDKFGVALPPSGPEGRFVHYGVNGFAINSATAAKDEAWEFVEFLLKPEMNTLLNENWGAIPSVEASLEAEYLKAPVFEKPKQMVQMETALVNTPRELPEWGNFFVNYGPEQIQTTLLGRQTPEQFAAAVSDYLEKARVAN